MTGYCNQHFAPYLASKGETREYHYSKDDFVAADEETFDTIISTPLKALNGL